MCRYIFGGHSFSYMSNCGPKCFNEFLKVKLVSSTTANCLSCKPVLFFLCICVANTSSGMCSRNKMCVRMSSSAAKHSMYTVTFKKFFRRAESLELYWKAIRYGILYVYMYMVKQVPALSY